jgi:hypothetical protein
MRGLPALQSCLSYFDLNWGFCRLGLVYKLLAVLFHTRKGTGKVVLAGGKHEHVSKTTVYGIELVGESPFCDYICLFRDELSVSV